jgi:predicted RNase H-like nuclease (RuvC/YqgF family)
MNDKDLTRVENEIKTLHNRSNETKSNVSRHEAVCDARYAAIASTLQEITKEIQDIKKEVKELNTTATKGNTALRTLLWVGGAFTGIVALLYNMWSTLPK